MIRFSCPGCGAVYSVTDDKAGKTGKCPKCQTPFTIPAAETPAPVVPPPPPPPPVSSNPFADLGEDGGLKKKKAPSKADLDDDDDDRPRKKKTPSKADLDDEEDDRPKKKPARRDEDDGDDRPRKKSRRDDDEDDDRPKKKSARRDEDEEEERPRKKSRRDDDEDDFEDRPKKKSARASEDDDYDDDRPRKKRGRRDDDDYDDDYDRPKKKKSSGLLLTAAILHIIAAVLYLPCGGTSLAGASVAGDIVNTGDDASRPGRNQIRGKGDPKAVELQNEAERRLDNAKTGILIFQIALVMAVLGGCIAIPASVAAFTKKKWFTLTTLITGGIFILSSIITAVALFGFWAFQPMLFLVIFVLVSLLYGGFCVFVALNKNVKKVLA